MPQPLHLNLQQFRGSKYPAEFEKTIFAYDFEANTNKPQAKDLYIRSVAVANEKYCVGVDLLDASTEDWDWFLQWIVKQDLIVYNGIYDQGLLYAKTGKLVKPYLDLYIVFKMLGGKKSAEDDTVRYGLKAAQLDLLSWQNKGSDELHEYMKANKLSWADVKLFPADVLLRYNCLDANSTYALYKHFQTELARHWDTWGQYFPTWHREDCLGVAMEWVEALHSGMPIDEPQLETYYEVCLKEQAKHKEEFLSHPQLREGVALYNAEFVEKVWDNPPRKFKKSGELTVNWVKRAQKYEAAKKINHFNLNSPQQIKWLLYSFAKIPSPKPEQSTDAESLGQLGEIGDILLNYRAATSELKFLNQLTYNNQDGVLYPNVVFPGTDTGRVVSREEIA